MPALFVRAGEINPLENLRNRSRSHFRNRRRRGKDDSGIVCQVKLRSSCRQKDFRSDAAVVFVTAAAEDPVIWNTAGTAEHQNPVADRKSTRLNSSHSQISYAVFCLKK